jgi:2-oxoglutarate ferredoxin oxidoreductase subunit beta
VDLTYVVMNNQVYGLTTGQISPTSSEGMKTKSTPFGSIEMPVNPITASIMNGATFVARGFSGDPKHLAELMKQAMQHRGFALIDVFSPCVTFNHDNDYAFFRPRVTKLEDEGHDTSDWKAACEKALLWDETIYIGLFFRAARPALDEHEPILRQDGPLAYRPLGLTEAQSQRIIERMM